MSENEEPAGKIIVTRPTERRRRAAAIAGKVFAIGMCALLLIGGTVFGQFYAHSKTFSRWFDKNAGRLAFDVLRGRPLDMFTWQAQFKDRTDLIVLVLGVDHDYDDRDRIIKSSPGRSDAILLARVDFTAGTVSALTIPRDTAVEIPGRRGIHKINAAHNFGGVALTMDTIQTVFDVKPDCAITVSLEGFQKIVDAVGGVDVVIHKRLKYDDNWGNLHINLMPGPQHLNGYQAMGYVRMRHSDSDFMRSQRQHEFLEALRQRVRQPGNIARLPSILDRAMDAISLTTLDNDQLYALANFARQLPRERITLETLPSNEGPAYVSVDAEKSLEVIRRIFYPNRQVAVAINAPSPSTVDAMNSPYARGGRRGRHGRKDDRAKPVSPDGIDAPAPAGDEAPAPGGEDPAPSTSPGGDSAPAPGGAAPDAPAPPPDPGAAGHG